MKILWLVLIVTGIFGYISNLIDAVKIDDLTTMTAYQAVEFVGVFLPPMGSFVGVLSWF